MPAIFQNVEAGQLHSCGKLSILSKPIDSVDIRTLARMSQDDVNRTIR